MAKSNLADFISWIDLSDEDQKRARDYLRSLDEGTLDELGFGVIRDTFADTFFPATSTIMTRARHFILVPSIYIHVLRLGFKGDRARKRCDQLEHQLRETLIKNKSIPRARKKGERIQRYPASIYWAGLRRLNILKQPGSQARYFNQLESFFDERVVIKDDDKNTHLEADCDGLWHPDLLQLYDDKYIPTPMDDGAFDEDTDFKITRLEADFLKARFLEDPNETLVSNAFQHDKFEKADYPWEWQFPTGLERQIKHARHFSMITKLATLLYYKMVDQCRVKLGKPSIDRDITEVIKHWFSVARPEILEWSIEDFLNWGQASNCLRRNDAVFFTGFFKSIQNAKSPSSFCQSHRAQNLVVERERAKRPAKRRLTPGRFQNDWQLPGQSESYYSDPNHIKFQLDFRSGIASQLINDIFEGPTDGQ